MDGDIHNGFQDGALFDAQNDAGFVKGDTALNHFLNGGVFRKSAGTGATYFAPHARFGPSVSIVNGVPGVPSGQSFGVGLESVQTGTLRFAESVVGNAFDIAAGSTVDFGTGGIIDPVLGSVNHLIFAPATFRGQGKVRVDGVADISDVPVPAVNVEVAGRLEVSAGSALNVSGNYTQYGSGTLTLSVANSASGLAYGQVNVAGQAALAGTLEILGFSGYQPPQGSSFVALTYGSRAGSFSSIVGTDLGAGLYLDPVYGDHGLTLTVRHQ
jgi:hypothetical protein